MAAAQPRPVWLTPAQRDLLTRILIYLPNYHGDQVREIIRAWDAAPANPVGVVTKELSRTFAGPTADSVLRALGMPQEVSA